MLCAVVAVRAETAQRLTAAQLERFVVAEARETGDGELADQIGHIELTERLSSADLARLKGKCGGDACRRALTSVADRSAFVETSLSDADRNDVPSVADQKEILAKLVTFIERSNRQMPNFIATRTIARFEDWPKGLEIGHTVPARTIPLEFEGETDAIITYQNGREIVAADKTAPKHGKPATSQRQTAGGQGLFTWGLFGSMLTTVIVDASRSELSWSHWEQSEPERLAVFRFAVPMDKSTYQVKFCCVPMAGGFLSVFDRRSAYHGELAMNAADGAIVRITLMADLDQGDLETLFPEAAEGQPLSRANLAVEYGPVEIGGKIYTCPVKAVALSMARTLLTNKKAGPRLGPTRTYLDDIRFTGYHVFRSESRIVGNPAPQ